jgi:hypothetical protein
MLFLSMLIFLSVSAIGGMQNEIDIIEKDYAVLVPYVIKMLQITKEDFTPFELLNSLMRPEALINKNVVCGYLSPSKHIELIMKKHRIRMARDWGMQKIGPDKELFHRWFVDYFQRKVVPRMVQELKNERDEKSKQEQHSSSGV